MISPCTVRSGHEGLACVSVWDFRMRFSPQRCLWLSLLGMQVVLTCEEL